MGQATGRRSLKQILRDRLTTQRTTPPLTADGWLRASRLADMCPRAEALCARLRLVRTETIEAPLALTFAHGHGLHWALQHHILPEVGVLVGQWRCLRCARLHGGVDPTGQTPAIEQHLRRPAACAGCGQTESRDWQYVEQQLTNEEYRIGGHPDGFLVVPGMPGYGILEAKSAGAKTIEDVKSMPRMEHVIQCHVYMWFTGFQWAKILYWDKAGQGLGALYEHTVERDPETIELIQRAIRLLWAGVRGDVLPPRICTSPEAGPARKCGACGPCFAEPTTPAPEDLY